MVGQGTQTVPNPQTLDYSTTDTYIITATSDPISKKLDKAELEEARRVKNMIYERQCWHARRKELRKMQEV